MKYFTTISAILAVAACCLFSSSAAANSSFADINEHWAKEYIMELYKNGAVTGMDDGLFHPDENITNAQLITMLIRNRFGEIEPVDEKWYSGYMDFALQNGIITDFETEFPDTAITRQSTARIVHELLLNAYNEQDDANWQDAEALSDLYSCHTCVMHIAQVYIKGIMDGRDDGAFHLTDTLTRAEAAAVAMRIIDPSLRNIPSGSGIISDTISATEADELMKNGAILIDVRRTEEYNSGHIKGSISIPVTDIEDNVSSAMKGIKSDAIIIVYCRTGTNSHRAVKRLNEAGYNNVYDLGGIENGEYELVAE